MLAFILKRHDTREADQIITLFTAEHGQIEAVARGIKKSTAKNSAALTPPALAEVALVQGKEFWQLTTATPVTQYKKIRENLNKMLVAQYILGIIEQIIRGSEPEVKIFNLIISFFNGLEIVGAVTAAPLAAFIIRLAAIQGFSPELKLCAQCGQIVGTDESANFYIANGAIIHSGCILPNNRISTVTLEPLVRVLILQFLSGAWDDIFALNPAKKELDSAYNVVKCFVEFHWERSVPEWGAVDK